jgi:pantetheine-phosphate adenylyltransferase
MVVAASTALQVKRRALYAGSFDPPTNGHLWMIEEGAKLFDELMIVVGQNPQKKPHWSVEERVAILNECVAHLPNVEVRVFDGRYLLAARRPQCFRFCV